MKKANININILSKIVLGLAALLSLAAVLTLIFTPNINRTTNATNGAITEVSVETGDTLSKLLDAQGLQYADIDTIAKKLKADADISGLRAGSDKLVFERADDNAPVKKIILIPSPWKKIELTCDDSGNWACNTMDISPDTRMVRRAGKIGDGDSFYNAGIRAGIPAGIIIDVYDLLAFEMDFERDIRAGQEFSVLYEENYADGAKVENGRVIAIAFDALRGPVNMYRFKQSNGIIGYYDENGNGAIKSLKRTPINNARVSSSFNPNRKHPVLGYTRAHRGVDFRAGAGTPIPSAGAGRVIKRAYQAGGAGNYIRIRHNGSYETQYMHMSRFAKGIGVGSTVKQGQIIGYVGSTGVSTGPHLHYEIIKDGKHVNPLTVKLPAINNLDSGEKGRFLKMRELVDSATEMLSSKPDLFIQM